MPERDRLVAEADRLLAIYRDISRLRPEPEGIHGVGVAIGRALETLDLHETKDTLDSAAVQLAAVRETLVRIRRELDR